MVSNTESQGLVVRRVGVLRTRIWTSKRLVDETVTLSRAVAWHNGWVLENDIEVKRLWLQQAMDEKLATKPVSTESNVADIGTKGFDERQDMETDEPRNEFGCWGVVSCAAANGDKHGDVESCS